MDHIDRIKAEREDHDESQRDIAKILGMSQSQYQKYEAKINAIPIKYLIEICKHYQVSADYLLGLPEGLNWPRRPREEDKLTNSNHSTKYDFDMLTVIIAVSFSYIR